MTFLSILCALLIEQIRPLHADNPVHAGVRQLAGRFEHWFNSGQASHGRLAWIGMVVGLSLPVLLVYWLAYHLSPLLAFAWNVLILYLTLGFRQYSHRFSSIQFALNTGDMRSARALIAEWTGQETVSLSATEIFRRAVEKALLTSHRQVFAIFFWFLLPIGPAGAVLYRVAEYLARAWNEPTHLQQEQYGDFAARAFYWIDWIPARLTAAAFAVVGNFEEALYAWRNFAARWTHPTTGIILAAGGGAMGVNLEPPLPTALRMPAAANETASPAGPDILKRSLANAADPQADSLDSMPGETPSVRTLQSTVGLIWRALVLWMLVLLLLSLAASLG